MLYLLSLYFKEGSSKAAPLVEQCATFRRIVVTLFSRYSSPARSRLAARNEPTKKPIRKPTNPGDVREDASTTPERMAIPGLNGKAKYGGRTVGMAFINIVTRHGF